MMGGGGRGGGRGKGGEEGEEKRGLVESIVISVQHHP